MVIGSTKLEIISVIIVARLFHGIPLPLVHEVLAVELQNGAHGVGITLNNHLLNTLHHGNSLIEIAISGIYVVLGIGVVFS